MNILIVKTSAIGDVIHTLPALNALRAHFPSAHITWLVEEAAATLVNGHQFLDRVLISKRKTWVRGLLKGSRLIHAKEIYSFIRELRDTEYDLIIDFQGLLKSGLLIAIAKGKRKIGFDKGMEHAEQSHLFLNDRVPPVSMEIHALTRGMMLLSASLGIQNQEIVFDLPVQDVHRDMVRKLFLNHGMDLNQPFAVIHPIAKWETKLWNAKNFSSLADRLIDQYGVNVIFTGSGQDRKTIQDMILDMKGAAANLAGETSLMTLASVFEKSRFLVSTDTGPMHMAVAMKTPVVALFGPTAPWRTGPFGPGHQIVRAKLKCAPCFKRSCQTIECMAQISVESVLKAIQHLGII